MAIRPVIKSEDNYLSKLIKYIPSEIVAAYISLRAIVSTVVQDPNRLNNR